MFFQDPLQHHDFNHSCLLLHVIETHFWECCEFMFCNVPFSTALKTTNVGNISLLIVTVAASVALFDLPVDARTWIVHKPFSDHLHFE